MKYLIALALSILTFTFYSQNTESPYLEILTENAVIPLKGTKADVDIAGTIAHVKITQVYHNEGEIPIEAKYVFPMSIQAAVHKMEMKIGGRTIIAKVFEKEEAKKVYNQAISEGKRAAKLDQQRPNVFEMNVGNIMPGDEITIDIFYTEALIPVAGDYQFVFPGVVGPRFTGENKSGESTFNLAYSSKGVKDTYEYKMHVTIQSGIPIKKVNSSSHDILVDYPDKRKAEVSLSDKNENPSNRDFILNYNLRGDKIESGLLLYEHNDEKFFAYVMEPIKRPKQDEIPPREYLFIVDVSGSMNGYPLDVSKELMRNLLGNLRVQDEFNILLFASSSVTFKSFPVKVNEANIEEAIQFMTDSRGGGGTQLINALNTAYAMPRNFNSSARSMVVITDGYVSVEKQAFELIRNNLDKANVFTFGIGSSVNRYLIDGMAKVSNSESFIATYKTQAFEVAEKFKEYIETPLLTQVKLVSKGFDMYDVEPASIPDVMASRPVVVYGKYRGKAEGELLVSGYQGGGEYKQKYQVADGLLSNENVALRYLWARKKIELLDDYQGLFDDDVKDEVTELGLKYNLVTQYTSFVAVDNVVTNESGEIKQVKQVLPMPQNVQNSAVGAEGSIEAKTKYQSSFKTTIIGSLDELDKTEERKLKMWFKTEYSDLIKKALKTNSDLRFHFDKTGELESVEILINGIWIESKETLKEFLSKQVKLSGIHKSYLIEINSSNNV